MARLRTIKPEFWSDERVGECSPMARLVFIASWNFADDYGGLDRSPKQLKAQAFPYDAIDVEPLVQELIRMGLFIEYTVEGKNYLHINGFLKHQRVEKPARRRIPLYEPSPNSRGVVGEDSPGSYGLSLGLGSRLLDLDLEVSKTRATPEPEGTIFDHITAIKLAYPTPIRADWITAEKLMRQLVRSGEATWSALLDGVIRYAAVCKATTRAVLNPARFFGDVDKPWSQQWPIPATKAEGRLATNIDVMQQFVDAKGST